MTRANKIGVNLTTSATAMKARGFTLVELMAVLGIIAILTAIALPSYQSYVLRSNRADAQRMITTIANRESQYLIDARTFTAALAGAGLNLTGLDGWTCTNAQCTSGSYTITVALGATPADGFTVTAAPVGRQTKDGTLRLVSSGTRTRIVGGVDKGW